MANAFARPLADGGGVVGDEGVLLAKAMAVVPAAPGGFGSPFMARPGTDRATTRPRELSTKHATTAAASTGRETRSTMGP